MGEFLLKTKLVDEVVEVDKTSKKSVADSQDRLIKQEFRYVICPHESLRTQLLCIKLKAEFKFGFHKWWNGLIFNKTIKRNMNLPDALRQLNLITLMDKDYSEEYQIFVSQYVATKQEVVQSQKVLHLKNKISKQQSLVFNKINESSRVKKIALAPGSVWATKRWSMEKYKELTLNLIKSGYEVYLFGSPNEKELCDQIASKVPEAKNYAGELSLFESYEKLAEVDLLISNDSGAMHLAACSDTYIISIFGPTVKEFGYEPWVTKSTIISADISCRPCGSHGAKKCPLGTHECMELIEVADVTKALERYNS
jgi:heptosyltransferase II